MTNTIKNIQFLLFIFCFSFSFAAPAVFAQETADVAEQVETKGIKEKYWAKGDESKLRVVQNRLYTKTGRFELTAFGGVLFQDPFLSIKNAGAGLAYHMSEFFAIRALFWKDFVGSSSALETFQREMNSTVNSNYPQMFYGLETAYSLIYGKLSILGKAIIYYDMFFDAGVGATKTESGTYISPIAGLGQQIYLSKNWALRLDYRATYYNEKILQKVSPAKMGSVVGTRSTFSNIITLGISFFL